MGDLGKSVMRTSGNMSVYLVTKNCVSSITNFKNRQYFLWHWDEVTKVVKLNSFVHT